MAKTNSLNSGSIEELNVGETIFTQLIVTASKKNYQVEFAERIDRGTASGNLLAALNDGDERFSGDKPRYGWMTVTLKGFCKSFGLDPKEVVSKANKTKTSKGKEAYTLNILNPVFSDKGATKQYEGQRARLEITETTTPPSEWSKDNFERSAKQVNGEFITHNGMAIFTETNMVPYEPEHTFLESDRIANVDREPIFIGAKSKASGKSLVKKSKKKKESPFHDLDS